jgi:Bacterial membrane protein YfhO
VTGEDAALAAITTPGFDARRAAVVERPVAGLADGPAPPAGSARIAAYEPERVTLTARADRRGLVVLSDVAFPGWQATVDGRAAPIERVDYLLRGIPVGPGTHRIVLQYRPLSWRGGWIVSLLALLGLAAAVWQSARRWPARSSAR